MNVYVLILAGANILTGLLSIGLAVPLLLGRIGRNRWYGVRLAKAMASDEHWYAINRHGGAQLAAYGAVLVLIGVVALFVAPLTTSWVFWVILFAPIILLVPVVAQILRHAARL